ncbi:MAG: hypothetical protein GXP27_05055 [Planctomycetes bacterium]|nr:hypothetical protein [Planctomycetota bacterium]
MGHNLANCLAIALTVALTTPTVGGDQPRHGRGNVVELQEAYLHVMRASAKRRPGPPDQIVPQLAVIYAALDRCEKLSAKRKRQMRAALQARMKSYRDQLLRRLRKSEAERSRLGRSARPRGRQSERLRGPADEARARQLIELIESTIAPESWQSSGGPGSIRYFSLLQALVVRQTGPVHRQIGDLLELLRSP